MQSTDFVHLHLHTQYSLLDGAIRFDDLIAKAKELNMPAVAMTDHGNMFGAVEFYLQVQEGRRQADHRLRALPGAGIALFQGLPKASPMQPTT